MAGGIAGNLVMGVARLAAMRDADCSNAKKCREIERMANRAKKDLQAQKGKGNNNSRVRDALDDLERSIRRALRLVSACQTGDRTFLEQVLRLYRAEDISNKLKQVQDDLTAKMAAATFSIMSNNGMAPVDANPARHHHRQEHRRPEEHTHERHHRHAHERHHRHAHQKPQEHPHQIAARQRPHQEGNHHHHHRHHHAPQRPVANEQQRPVAQRAHVRHEVRAHGHGSPEVHAHRHRRRHAMPDN